MTDSTDSTDRPDRLQPFDELLTGVVDLAAGAARPAGASAARARGHQRDRRARMAVTTMSVVLVLCGTGAALAVVGPWAHGTTSPAASRQVTGGPSGPAGKSSAPQANLDLNVPGSLAAGVLNEVSFTAQNPGAARTVTARVSLGTTTLLPGGNGPDELGVVQRLDPSSGIWTPLSVEAQKSDAQTYVDVASYQLTLPAHGSVTEHLRITPVGTGQATTGVSLDAGSAVVGSATVTSALVEPQVTGTGPSTMALDGTPGHFTFTVSNPTAQVYSGVYLFLGSFPSAACSSPLENPLQWTLDGGSPQLVTAENGWSQLGGTITIPADQSAVVTVTVPATVTDPNCTVGGDLALYAELPGAEGSIAVNATQSASATQPPGFGSRADLTFTLKF